jgi:hypothetical protein
MSQLDDISVTRRANGDFEISVVEFQPEEHKRTHTDLPYYIFGMMALLMILALMVKFVDFDGPSVTFGNEPPSLLSNTEYIVNKLMV